MSVFSWLFKSSSILQPDKQPKQVASLRKEIGQERETFNEVWRAHEAKTKLLNRLGSTNRKTILAKIDRSNEIIIDSLKRLISINKLEETLLKKILFESTHRLHETEGWLWKHGQSNPTALDQQTRSINTPEGRRQPYNIETKKRAVWAIVNDEKERNGFIQRAKKRLSGELERFKSVCKETMQLLKEQDYNIPLQFVNMKS